VPPNNCSSDTYPFIVQVSTLGVPDTVQLDDACRLAPPVCVIEVQVAEAQPAFAVERHETKAGSHRGSLGVTVQIDGAVHTHGVGPHVQDPL